MAKDNKLTPKQEAFCLAYVETGNASEAYRRAYSAGKMKDATVNRNASALLKNNKVATRLAELQARAEVQTLLTLEGHMTELQELRELAKERFQFSAAIKAEELRGKLRKFYVDRHEHTGEDGKPIEIVNTTTDELLTEINRLAARAAANGADKQPH